jgi:hypothetical protein
VSGIAGHLTPLEADSQGKHTYSWSTITWTRRAASPFTPAEVAPLNVCERCQAPWQPAGPWNFNEHDGTCLRDLVCSGCGSTSCQSGIWNPPDWQERY